MKYSIPLQIPTPKAFHHSKEQNKRLQDLKQFCVNHRKTYSLYTMLRFLKSPTQNKAHIYISHKKSVVYCGVPKVASTNWKRLLLLFEGTIPNETVVSEKESVHTVPQVKLFNMVSKQRRKYVLLNYYKFLFVRHPFERLASTYRNKFADNNRYFEQTYGSQVLRLYRANLTEKEYKAGKGITFKEFLMWIIAKRVHDGHWVPADVLCHPCTLPYDFIGKMETLVSDSEEVLEHIDAPGVHFPANKTDYAVSSRNIMFKLFSEVPATVINQLYEIYKVDFLAFGYQIPEAFYHGKKIK